MQARKRQEEKAAAKASKTKKKGFSRLFQKKTDKGVVTVAEVAGEENLAAFFSASICSHQEKQLKFLRLKRKGFLRPSATATIHLLQNFPKRYNKLYLSIY